MVSTNNMEGELFNVYEHNHQVEFIALEHFVQTPTNEPFDHENLLWKITLWHIKMNKALFTLLHLNPHNSSTWFHFGKEGQNGGWCEFFSQITSSTLIMNWNNCKHMNFQGLNFNFHWHSCPKIFKCIIYKCDVHQILFLNIMN